MLGYNYINKFINAQNESFMKKKLLLVFLMIAVVASSFAKEGPIREREITEWTVMQSWDIPGKASGLAWDGTYLYFGIYGADGDHFYRFDPSSGNIVLQFTNPAVNDCYGMTWDGTSLWITDHVTSPSTPAQAIEMNLSGNILSSFDLPDHYMSGIAYDAGDFWVGTYYPDPGTVYQVTATGSVNSQFTPPADQIWDICMQDNDLWMVDYNSNMIYKTDQSGNVLENHACENIKPSGIVYDGTYLWYVDGPLSSPSKLYKINLAGAGTPEINIPVQNHNYGNVTIGNSETWNMEVENVGDAPLEITNLVIPGSAPIFTSFTPPETIPPGNSIIIPLTYQPTQVGSLNVVVSVESTDPITPSEDVTLTGEAVNPGPSLYIPVVTHDYGEVRMGAYTRWFLEIQNIGDAPLLISEINSDIEAFIIDESVSLPLQIGTLDSEEIGIWFNPRKDFNYAGSLTIVNNDPAHNPALVSLAGEGVDLDYPIGTPLWSYMITTGYDHSPKAIIPIQDITGDTVSDLVICSEDNFVRAFNGNSSGIADVMWEVEIDGGNTYDQKGLATISDIDADGYADVVVGTAWGDRSIRAFSGKYGGQIWKHDTHEYGSGGWVYAVDVSFDYNNDGIDDVLAATGDDSNDIGPKRVYCLNALDGVSIWETYIGGPVFSVMGVEDFTGDGIADVIAGASNADETQGSVIGIDGSNGNIKWTKTTAGTSVWALMQVDDVSGDGVKDIVAGDFGGNFYGINPVNNTPLYQGVIYGAIILRFENMADVNGDGHDDVLVAHSKTNAVVFSGLDGSTVWFKPLADKSWNVAVSEDITGDGINDVQIGTLFGSNYCYFLDGVDGAELKSINYITPIDAINALPDIVGDGSMEMVAGGRDGKVYCYSGGYGLGVTVEENEGMPAADFSTNYPNPFSVQTTIAFHLDKEAFVLLRIYDISGTVVRTITNTHLTKGSHRFSWDGNDQSGKVLSPGFYFYEIQTESARYRKKMVKL